MPNSTTPTFLSSAVAGWRGVFAPLGGSQRIAAILTKHNRRLPQGCFPMPD